MQAQRVAIVGLGRVGSMFLQALLERRDRGLGIEIVAVSELQSTAGLAAAEAAGIAAVSLPRLIEMARDIDIVFDLSGSHKVRQDLRQGMAKSGNSRTVIAPESIARLLWSLLAAGELPAVHGETGYGA